MIKKDLVLLVIFLLFVLPVFAIDLDTTVDDAIRKNYNVDAIKNLQNNKTPIKKVEQQSNSLPKLPSLPKNVIENKNITSTKVVTNSTPKTYKILPIRKGMEFNISNTSTISDKQRIGSSIVFIAKKPIKTAYYTIPQGTKFVGKIQKSHTPQLTGNGGLISINVDKIILGGIYQKIDTKIVKVGDKHVFLEEIKGKRSYWKNTVNKGKWGRQTFHKMNKLSASLARDKTTVILSPFTFMYGAMAGGISTLTSPVVAIFSKGGHLTIPANTIFKIKFENDVKLYY